MTTIHTILEECRQISKSGGVEMRVSRKVIFMILVIVLFCSLDLFPLPSVYAQSAAARPYTIQAANRLWGNNRYQTANAIAERYNNGQVDNVILASGNNFPDALAASVLAYKLKAPILLVDASAAHTVEAFAYIKNHFSPQGHVYIAGGPGLIGVDFHNVLNSMGYAESQITQIGGLDRYETSALLAKQLQVAKGTPVVITTGENFRDALTVSSFAAKNGWPVLLAGSDLSSSVKDVLSEVQPSQVYIAGDADAVSESVAEQIKTLLPASAVERLSGLSAFATEIAIIQKFAPNPTELYLASANVFADALSGSVLAAQTGAPIVLVDPKLSGLPAEVASFLKGLSTKPDIQVFGGSGAVPDELVTNTESVLQGNLGSTPNQCISIVAPTINGEASNIVDKVADNLHVRTGVNMDLLYIATETGGNFQNPQGYLLNQDAFGINAAVKSYFGKYVSNESAKDLFNQAMQVPNPPHKFVGSEFTDVLQSDEGTLLQPSGPATWDTLSKFESDTKATDFFTENRTRYEQMVQDFVKTDLNFNHVQQLQDFFGKNLSKDRFEIVLSTIENGGQATWLDNADGTATHIIIINPSDNAGILNVLYHETAHNFYDVRMDDPDLVNQYAQYANALGHHEADFGTELNETLARVVTLVMIDKYHGKEAAMENLNLVTQSGWKNTKEIATLVLNKYMNNRSQYKTFRDFMPVIFEYLKASSLQQPFDIGPAQF